MKLSIRFLIILSITIGLGLTSSSKVSAAEADPTYYQCTGEALATYMNAIVDAKANGKIPANVQLLSPAFNMTSYTFSGIAQGMKDAGAKFQGLEGIAGNVYNVAGQPISHYMSTVKQQFPSGSFYITETGTFDHSQSGIDSLANELNSLGGEYKALLLFNAFGSNPGWTQHSFTDDQLRTVCSGGCGRVGVNSANFFDQPSNFYSRAQANGMQWTLEIANRNGVGSTVKGVQNAHAAGLIPIIRIGVGSDSGGFNNPADYINFLYDVGTQAGGTIFAIAGPNEPDLERWATPLCAPIGDVTFACGGPLNLEHDYYRGEIIGLNDAAPYTLAVVDLQDEADTVEGLANIISANLTVTATYKHIDFKPIVDQLVGTIGQGEYNVNTRTDDFKPPTHLLLQIPGVDTQGSFEIANKPPKDPNQDYLSYTKELFATSTRQDEEKFGVKGDMKATQFVACIQRSGCNPKIEKCVKAEYSFEPNACGKDWENCLCATNDIPENCLTFGQVIQLNGEIKFEEPSDLHALERAYYNIKRSFSLLPGDNDRWSAGPVSIAGLVPDYRTQGGQEYLALYGTPEEKTLYNVKPTSQYMATPAKAAVNEGSITNGVSASVNGSDGHYNVNYRYCVAHTSPCGLGDISSTINGTEVILWGRTTTEQGTCLEPGWGGAPSFNNVSLPFSISVSTKGRVVDGGNPGLCPQEVAASCTISKVNGEIVSDCQDFIPYDPPPLDCRNCQSWAPSGMCSRIEDKELISNEECVDGSCTAKSATIDSGIPYEIAANWTIRWGDIPFFGWIFNLFTSNDETNLRCSISGGGGGSGTASSCSKAACPAEHGVVPCGVSAPGGDTSMCYLDENDPSGSKTECTCRDGGGLGKISCAFTSRQYQVYVYPQSFEGDLNQYRADDMNANQALFQIPGVTDKYFDPKNAKAPAQVKLAYDGAIANNANGTSKIDLGNKFIFNNGGNTREMYISYNNFLQPQFSGWCLSRAFTNPFGDVGNATEYCNQFDFVAGGSDSQRPISGNNVGVGSVPNFPTDVEGAISVASTKNGVPDILLKAILEIEAGPKYDPNSECKRNYPWTATGPMQITDGILDDIATQEEQDRYNLKTWVQGDDHSSDGRCPIGQAMDLGARVIKVKVGVFDINNPESGKVNLTFEDVKKAARGYYGSCKPDIYTAANFKDPTISYCDMVLYKVGICQTLSASCDGEVEEQQGASLFDQIPASELNKAVGQFNQNSIATKTKDQIKTDLLRDIEKISSKYIDQFDPKNTDKIPAEMQKELEQLGKDYMKKYNLRQG